MNPTATGTNVRVTPDQVHATLAKHMLADGFDFVLDLDKSEGVWIWDSRGQKKLMDFFSFFASNPVGMNHPGMKTPEFQARLAKAALHNVTNSDVYTTEMAEFVETFATKVTPKGFPHHFWVSGGALAVENALKVAFDWKARRIGLDSPSRTPLNSSRQSRCASMCTSVIGPRPS